MKQIDLEPGEWRSTRIGKAVNAGVPAFTAIVTAIIFGVGLSIARGDFDNIPLHAVPQIVLGGIAIFFLIFGSGYVVCKAWDWLIARLKSLMA